jgi:3D (Asp-Asp-Asp) domain-containing protein
VATSKDAVVGAEGARRRTFRVLAQSGVFAAAAVVTAASAVLVKELQMQVQPLAALEVVHLHDGSAVALREPRVQAAAVAAEVEWPGVLLGVPEEEPGESTAELPAIAPALDEATLALAQDPSIRWFNGRPVRPARQMWMTVTGYSPDAASCAPFDDGLTATLHSVRCNAMKMVAADTRLLPFGSMLTVPGYDDGQVVPVLDRGGAIKGQKLDLMFPTHNEALKWGRQRLQVTVWEYADGLPPDNPRAFR